MQAREEFELYMNMKIICHVTCKDTKEWKIETF